MALIDCPDCGTHVSDIAPACPHCGRPIAAMTIEQTGKWFKGWKLIAVALALIGIMVCFTPHVRVGVFLIGAGILLFIIMSIAAWWEHG